VPTIVFAMFLPAIALTWMLSRHRALGILRSSALNPMLVVLLLAVLAAADFTSMAALGHGELGRHIVSARPETIASLALAYSGMWVAFLLGIAAVFYSPRIWSAPPPSSARVDMSGFLLALYVGCLILWLSLISAYSANFFTLQGSVEAKIGSSGDPILYSISLLLLPALSYALCRQRLRVAIPLVVLTIAVVFFSGSRTRVLYAIVPFFFFLVMVRGFRLPRSYFIVGVVVLGFLSTAALNLRGLISYSRAVSAESTFALTNPLNTPDIALAEASIALSRLDGSRITPFPGEGLVGFVTAPFPRAVVPFKPRPGSVQFTVAYDPERWRTTGSGLIIGAVNEIEYDYPYPIALIVIGLFGAGWALAVARAVRSSSIHGFPAVVTLYVFVINFFRGDLYIAGGVLFVFVLYAMIVSGYRRFQLVTGAGERRRPAHRAHLGLDEQHPVAAIPGLSRR